MEQCVRQFWMFSFHSSLILFQFLDFSNKNKTRIEIIVLHSTSSAQQRCLAFRKTGPRVRKVILATNIAESSITVPDVKYGMFFLQFKISFTHFRLNNFNSFGLLPHENYVN